MPTLNHPAHMKTSALRRGSLSMLLLAALGLPCQALPMAPQSSSEEVSEHSGLPQESGSTEKAKADEKKPKKGDDAHGSDGSRLSADPIPLAKLPKRPRPILELGSHFLGTGRLRKGFRIPGGAIWQPSFLLFGTFRSGFSIFDDDQIRTAQWANRLDLFGNLYLSGTERVVFGLRPMDETTDQGTRRFSGGLWRSPDLLDRNGGQNGFNFDWDTVTHLFFEGDFGELFPNLDKSERKALDLGFSVGRQPINFQEGLLINDFIDAIGITRNNAKPRGTVNLRVTGLFAWNQINRNTPSNDVLIRNLEADSSRLFGIFTETDWRWTTMAVDAIFVDGGTFRQKGLEIPASSGLHTGISFVQRFGTLNSSFRLLGSIPIGDQTPQDNPQGIRNPSSGGALFFSEISWTPHHSLDLVYLTGFTAFDDYRAAALDSTIPGPLARAGFLFAGPGLGNFPGALSSTAEKVIGGAAGYQHFLSRTRQQLLLEFGGRASTENCRGPAEPCGGHSLAGGARFQIAIGRRTVLVFDGYAAWEDLRGLAETSSNTDSRFRLGSRIEMLVKF